MVSAAKVDPAFNREIGFRLKQLRQTRRVSQQMLADRLGVVYQTVQKYESGEIALSIDALHACAKALNVSLTVFFDEELHEALGRFDRRTITLAAAIADLPTPDLAQKVYHLVRAINEATS